MTIQLVFSDGRTSLLAQEQPVLISELLLQQGVPFDLPCGGKRRCRKCKIQAVGDLSALTEEEKRFLSTEELSQNIRYACMATVQGDAKLTLLPEPASVKILADGSMPALQRQPLGTGLGIAVDIGTTTVVAYLYDLRTGTRLQYASCRNPQSAFGADVISRMEKSMAGERETLAQTIRRCLQQLSEELCRSQQIMPADVTAMVITGNTAMLYFLCGQDPASIAFAPFEPDRIFGEWITAESLHLAGLACPIYLPRCISAYVGADITTAILAADLLSYSAPTLLADIGTNGEMALWANGELFCCSTAAGPAFEGAGIYHGMQASQGAISKVWLEGTRLCWETVGNVPAAGLCGSGLIDLVAALCQLNIVEESGLIQEENHDYLSQIVEIENAPAFCLPDTGVILTQKDIRSVQLAKAAICAGIETLIQEAGLRSEDIGKLLLAGGFGTFLDVNSAERIGLIPKQFACKAQAIGNAAGMGAAMILQSYPCLEQSLAIAQEAKTVELSTHAAFLDAYVENMLFPGEA